MMEFVFWRRMSIILAVALMAVAGCGGTKNPIVPVQGKIQFDSGKPLPTGTRLLFNPVLGGVGSATGTTKEDGSFELIHVLGSAGAEEGKYTVQLLPPEAGAGDFTKIVPKDYRDGAVLSVEIKAGMAPLDFKVKTVN